MAIEDHLQPGEEILHRAHVTLLSLFPGLAALVLLIAGGVAIQVFTSNLVATLAVLALAVLVALWVGWKLLVLRSNQYIVTNHRVIRQTGLLTITSMDSRLDKVNNVEHRQTLWGRILHFGDVEIDTASEVGKALFVNISNPLDFKHAIVQAAEQYRAGNRAVAPVAGAGGPSGADRLRQLKALFDDGLISAAEYEAKRRELMAQL